MFQNLALRKSQKTVLADLIHEQVLADEEFSKYVNIVDAEDKEPLSYIGEMDDVGWEGGGCDPEYKNVGIDNSQKIWDLGKWQVPLKFCADSVEDTIIEDFLNAGTDVDNIINTKYWREIISPRLERAMKRMIWRFGWMGDKNAQTVSEGGVITDGKDVTMFTTANGHWKNIFGQVAENEEQRTVIAANSAATYAEAKAAMLQKGVATGIIDKVLMDADPIISDNGGAIVMMTRSMASALHYDVKERFNMQLEWRTIFDGFEITEYDGVQIARIGIWDEIIRAYENNGTKLNLPYRVVYAKPENFLVGVPEGQGIMSTLDLNFDPISRWNYVYAKGKLGTMLLHDELFQAAY